jgi:hypothetical protein
MASPFPFAKLARSLIVLGCALALIFAEKPLPFF